MWKTLLSELTRLVNTIAAERPRTEKVVDIASARMPNSEPFPNAHQLQRGTQAPSLRDGAAPPPPPPSRAACAPAARVAPAAAASAPVVPAARVAPPAHVLKPAAAAAPTTLPNRSATIIRASFDDTPVLAVEHPNSGAAAIAATTQDEEAPAHEYFAQAPLQAGDCINFARSPRRGSWYLKVAGLTVVSLLMVGGAVAMKIGMPGLRKSPPLMLAADGPSKIALCNRPERPSALLLKDSAAPTVAPVKLVLTEEQPVDLLAQTPAPAPNLLAADEQSRPSQPAADGQTAPAPKPPAHKPPPPPPPSADGQLAPVPTAPIVAPSEGLGGAPASGRTLFPSAKRVKTVSVRPDGTLISSATTLDAPVAQTPAPTPSPAPVAATRKPENASAAALVATPMIDLPAKPEPKSSARISIAKPATPAPANSANAPQLGPRTHAAKPVRPPKPKPVAVADAAAPTQLNLLDLLRINKPAQTQAPVIARRQGQNAVNAAAAAGHRTSIGRAQGSSRRSSANSKRRRRTETLEAIEAGRRDEDKASAAP